MRNWKSFILMVLAATLWVGGTASAQNLGDYGDAPEGALAYPATGVIGSFPTCVTVGPAGFIYHPPSTTMFFGPMVDFEPDGNAGTCPLFAPYDQDECFADPDAGLIVPGAYTIVGGTVMPCAPQPGSLGSACSPATWGINLDIHVVNNSSAIGYVNVLMDWNQDGIWAPSTQNQCSVPEHILMDFPVPPGYNGPLSMLAPPAFTIGGTPGHVWSRFSFTDAPVNIQGWDGSGIFDNGESEDYLLLVDAVVPVESTSWGALKSMYR